jgi:hypothetical protein
MRLSASRFGRLAFALLIVSTLAARALQAAQYDVTTNADSGAGSLRAALVSAAGNPGTDTVFIQPGSVTAPIAITSATLNVDSPIVLEGNGATLTTAAAFDLLELAVGSNGSTIRGLALQRTGGGFTVSLILISSHGNTVTNCRVGTDWAGTTVFSPGRGITVTGWGNLIGGNRFLGQHNVLSGNTYGVSLYAASGGNTLCGNIVGLSADQSSGNTNVSCGIAVSGSGNVVGLLQAGLGNVVCSNQNYGIQIYGDHGSVRNNLIGINEAGAVFGNYRGVDLENGSLANLVGGSRNSPLLERNVISGNVRCQVQLGGSGNTVSGNFINTNTAGTAPLMPANEVAAVFSDSNGHDNLVGGSESDADHLRGNVICSKKYGIWSDHANHLNISGNRIGVLNDGSLPAHTQEAAVLLEGDGTFHWLVGRKGLLDNGNLVAKANTGVAVSGGHAGIYGNLVHDFSWQGIQLYGGANNSKAAPVITWVGPHAVSGTAASGDYVEVYRAEIRPGGKGGSRAFLGAVTAMGTAWSLNLAGALTPWEYVCATATDSTDNTSPFSSNVQLPGEVLPTETPTPVLTPTPAGELTGGAAVRAYPNPGKDQVHFVLNLNETSDVKINVYNLNGERVAGLRQTLSGQGAALTWACQGAGPGIYLARISVNGQEVAKLKVAVMK